MRTLRVGAELFHVDRRTDIVRVIFAFRNFANVPNDGNNNDEDDDDDDDDDDDRKRRRKFHSFTNHWKPP